VPASPPPSGRHPSRTRPAGQGRRGAVAGVATAALASALAPAAHATDAALVRALARDYPAAEHAAGRAAGGDPVAAQRAYDAARDLQERLRAAAPVSPACRPLLGALTRYAAARVREQEGLDRPSAADRARGRRQAAAARTVVARERGGCRPSGRGGRAPRPPALSPAAGEAFFGTVVAAAPAGADAAAVLLDGRTVAVAAVRGGRVRAVVRAAPGPHDVAVRFLRDGRPRGGVSAPGAVLLPPSARRAAPGRHDQARSRAVARALLTGPRYRAGWVQDLTSGRVGAVHAGAPFPAASTVKLGLLAGVLARLGPAPERSAHAHDLRALAAWSSNLAANRLQARVGASAAADGLRRLGARRSTYPGPYTVGTALQPGLAPSPPGGGPPAVSRRVTTAEDLAGMLYALHAAAVGRPGARRATGLTGHQARLALGWLAASQQRGDNVSLLAGGAPAGEVIAQKNGWIRAARLAAGIVYAPEGPRIVVLLTYDPAGVGIAPARALGARLTALG